MADAQQGRSEGPATDRHNAPVGDPTENVRALNDAATQRQDDLRKIESSHLRELLGMEDKAHKDRLRAAKALSKALLKGIGEKFTSVKIQLDLIERQRVEQKKDTKDAVDAALAAAKEAVKEQTTASGLAQAKSDASFTEQLKQLSTTFTTAINGLTLLLNDTKTRVERLENSRQAVVELRTDNRLTLGTVVGVVGAFVGFVSLVLAAIVFTTR